MQFPFEIGTWIVLVPILLALGVLQFAGSREQAAQSTSKQQPEAPEKRHRPGWLARWRAQRGVRHGWSRWTIGYSSPVHAAAVQLEELRHHAIVCGATGSGKTSALRLLMDAYAEQLPMLVVDCKASAGLQQHVAALPNSYVWTIGGPKRWDPLRGDPTSVANRLIQGEWFSREGDVYRATGERYLLWVLQVLDVAKLERTPELVLRYLEPNVLLTLVRTLDGPDAARIAGQVARLGQTEKEGIAGVRARFGLVLEGVAAPSLGPGLVLEDALRARQPVLFSLDAATYPELATKIGAWILLDLVRVAALRPGPCLVVVDEFSALGREGRHIVPLLARSRESGMACVLATQGLADLARVDRDLPQQIMQNTAVRLALRQGSAEDQEAWSALLGGAPLPFNGTGYVQRERARAVPPDDLAMLRTGEAFLQVMPGVRDGRRERLWIAAPRKLGAMSPTTDAPNGELDLNSTVPRSQGVRTGRTWTWPNPEENERLQASLRPLSPVIEWTDWKPPTAPPTKAMEQTHPAEQAITAPNRSGSPTSARSTSRASTLRGAPGHTIAQREQPTTLEPTEDMRDDVAEHLATTRVTPTNPVPTRPKGARPPRASSPKQVPS